MLLDKKKLFETAKALWPETIDISEGEDIARIYSRLEDSFDAHDDWHQLLIWVLYQSIFNVKKEALRDGGSVISIHDVSFEEFDRRMRENLLSDDSWKPVRAIYFKGDEPSS